MPKVLIVDDDRTTVRLLKILLELDGFEVATVGLGLQALALAKEVMPDIIMVDYHLADTSGREVIGWLRGEQTFAKTPIVITSGMNVEREALDAGANKFLLKPFEPGELPVLFTQLMAQ